MLLSERQKTNQTNPVGRSKEKNAVNVMRLESERLERALAFAQATAAETEVKLLDAQRERHHALVACANLLHIQRSGKIKNLVLKKQLFFISGAWRIWRKVLYTLQNENHATQFKKLQWTITVLHGERQHLKDQLQCIQSDLDELRKETQKYMDENKDLPSWDVLALNKRDKNQQVAIRMLEGDLSQCRQECESLRVYHAECGTLRQELRDAKAEIQALTYASRDRERLTAELLNAIGPLRQEKANGETVHVLRSMLQSAEERNNSFTLKIAASIDAQAKANEAKRVAEAKESCLRAQVEDLLSERERLLAQVVTFKKDAPAENLTPNSTEVAGSKEISTQKFDLSVDEREALRELRDRSEAQQHDLAAVSAQLAAELERSRQALFAKLKAETELSEARRLLALSVPSSSGVYFDANSKRTPPADTVAKQSRRLEIAGSAAAYSSPRSPGAEFSLPDRSISERKLLTEPTSPSSDSKTKTRKQKQKKKSPKSNYSPGHSQTSIGPQSMTSGSEVALHHAGERPEADDSKLKRDLQSPREVGPSPLSSSGGNTYMQRLQQTSVLDHLQLARPTSTATAITSRRKSTSPKRASTSLSPGSVGAVSIEKKERDKSKRLSHIPTGDDLIFN